MAGDLDILSTCPFPEVAETLQPYIKTRQDTNAIRGTLRPRFPLERNESSPATEELSLHIQSSTGARKAFWRALQAHQSAQAKYESLKADLGQLTADSTPGQQTVVHTEQAALLDGHYLPLLRQREKHRKLVILDRTLRRIHTTVGDAVTSSFDEVVKRELGDLPTPPSTSSFPDRELSSEMDVNMNRVKQALLTTKQSIDAHEKVKAELNAVLPAHVDPQIEYLALQDTHNELTTWMETQLALISEVSGSAGRERAKSAEPLAHEATAHSEDNIESLYEQYIEARRRLLDIVAQPPLSPVHRATSPDVLRFGSETKDADSRPTASETVLPYIARLLSTRQQEQDASQQTAHVRRQLISAEAQSNNLLGRLADESHLLQTDVSRGTVRGVDWKRAADAAKSEIRDTASRRLSTGSNSAEAARQTIKSVRQMPNSLDALLE